MLPQVRIDNNKGDIGSWLLKLSMLFPSLSKLCKNQKCPRRSRDVNPYISSKGSRLSEAEPVFLPSV